MGTGDNCTRYVRARVSSCRVARVCVQESFLSCSLPPCLPEATVPRPDRPSTTASRTRRTSACRPRGATNNHIRTRVGPPFIVGFKCQHRGLVEIEDHPAAHHGRNDGRPMRIRGRPRPSVGRIFGLARALAAGRTRARAAPACSQVCKKTASRFAEARCASSPAGGERCPPRSLALSEHPGVPKPAC